MIGFSVIQLGTKEYLTQNTDDIVALLGCWNHIRIHKVFTYQCI
jgi:hypothetical protein